MLNSTTIAAISTAQGEGGVGVIRISGADAIATADKVFKNINNRKLSDMRGYTAAFGKVFLNGEPLDEAVALVFRAPHSYTGEDVVELSCHGGVFITQQVLRAVIEAGASPAQAGEFTKRAFLNGKLDLTEAEAVADIISAKNRSAARAALEAKYGLDKPLMEQYVNYLTSALHFDFGPSLKLRGRDVTTIIVDGMRTSAKLGIIALILATVTGVLLGALAALRRNSVIDKVIMVITTACVSMPSFIMGSLLLILFAIKLKWLPANGSTREGLILPVITLALYPMSYITRLTRSSMLDVLGQDYIRTAKAKGVSERDVILKHALKNSLIPVITYFGPELAYIVTGSLVVEQIFAVPGIGRYFVSSITGRDYPLIMGTTIVLASLIVIMNLVSDIMYKVVDPRINLE